MTDMIQVIVTLLGHNPISLDGLERILKEHGFEIAGSGNNIAALAARFGNNDLAKGRVHIVIIDGPSESLGAANLSEISAAFPDARVVVLSDTFDFAVMVDCFREGAVGYIVKVSSDALVGSLRLIAMGEKVMPSNLAELLPKHPTVNTAPGVAASIEQAGLSARETEILTCLVSGLPNKVISRKLSISEATVKVHVKAILRKLGVQNRTQAAIWAIGDERGDAGPALVGYPNSTNGSSMSYN